MAVYGRWNHEQGDLTPLTHAQHEALNKKPGPLHVACVRNVIATIEPPEREGADGAWLINEPNGHEESLLFVPAVWDWVAQFVDGAPVVALPSRDVLLVSGAGDRDGIGRLIEAAQAVFADAEEPVSPNPILWAGTRWSDFTP